MYCTYGRYCHVSMYQVPLWREEGVLQYSLVLSTGERGGSKSHTKLTSCGLQSGSLPACACLLACRAWTKSFLLSSHFSTTSHPQKTNANISYTTVPTQLTKKEASPFCIKKQEQSVKVLPAKNKKPETPQQARNRNPKRNDEK